ncbi:MAG: extensin family protein [Hyphomicrobiaceae bacterium]
MGKCWAVAAATFLLAAADALAQTPAPPKAAATQVTPAANRSAQWPVKLSDAKGAADAAPVATWSQQEVEAAQARCAVLLKNLSAVAEPEAPLREGSECGTPAPMRLKSLGRSQVAFSPPPVVTCELIAVLAEWLERDVQPAARKHLGAPVARIQTMSSYSCRNAYGRARGRISEHGRANALDIASFVTARGQAAAVIADWGPTARQIAAQAAADAAAKHQAEAKAPQQAAAAPGSTERGGPRRVQPAEKQPVAAGAMVPLDLRAGLVIGIPGITLHVPGAQQNQPAAFGLGAPSRLGGPKPTASASAAAHNPPAVNPDGKTDFLRAIHQAACKRFNTALGPEANKTHLNHFHVDMAVRIKNTKVCD